MPITMTFSADTPEALVDLIASYAENQGLFDPIANEKSEEKPKRSRGRAKAKAKTTETDPGPKTDTPADTAEQSAKPEPEKPAATELTYDSDVRPALNKLVEKGADGAVAMVRMLKDLGAVDDKGNAKAALLKPELYAEAIEKAGSILADLDSAGRGVL